MEQLELYFNTINLTGDKLKEKRIKVGSQNEKILSYFKSRPGRSYTPFDVQQNNAELWDTPITSIRRAMTTLTDLGYLVMTDEMRPGIYGDNNHTWKYNENKVLQ